MSCHSCGETHEGTPDLCPDCGAPLVSRECIESPASGTVDGRLVTDGGQPTDDESSEGQSTGGQSTGGQSNDGQASGGQSTGGQSTGGQSVGPAADGGQTPTGTAGGQGTAAGSDLDVGDLIGQLPLKAGATIGAFAVFIPYLLLTLTSYIPLQRDEFGISAELYAIIVGFGPGERFVDLFIAGSDVTALGNVDPNDYPSIATELDAVVDTLESQPEALLLPLYVFAPLVCYLGGRYLAKKYASGDSPLEYVRGALALPVGAFPITLIVSLVFGVEALAGAVLLGGLFVPLLFGALGGLTVYAFRDFSWGASKLIGWVAVLLGIQVAVVLAPIPELPGAFEIDLAEHFLFSLMMFVGAVNFAVGGGIQGLLMFLLIVLITVGAGFLRVYVSDLELPTALDGARLGSSVVLGFLAAVALLAIFLPFLSLVISLPFGMNVAFATVLPDVAKFTGIVLLAAIYGMVFGAGGGALAIWHRDRENTQVR